MFGEAAAALRLPAELESDGLLMASELAANTLHARANVELEGAGARPIAAAPELWIYLRRAGVGGWELAVKVFDSLSGWKDGLVPSPDPFPVRWLEGTGEGGLVRAACAGQPGARTAPADPYRTRPGGLGAGGDARGTRA